MLWHQTLRTQSPWQRLGRARILVFYNLHPMYPAQTPTTSPSAASENRQFQGTSHCVIQCLLIQPEVKSITREIKEKLRQTNQKFVKNIFSSLSQKSQALVTLMPCFSDAAVCTVGRIWHASSCCHNDTVISGDLVKVAIRLSIAPEFNKMLFWWNWMWWIRNGIHRQRAELTGKYWAELTGKYWAWEGLTLQLWHNRAGQQTK